MNKFKAALQRFFYGRYGSDKLYNALLLTSVILLFIAAVLGFLGNVEKILGWVSMAVYLLAYAALIWALVRFFSRNITARQRENARFIRFLARLRHPFKGKKNAARTSTPADTPEHIFRQCRHCRATLRLPRQVGKHTVKCPRCGKRFKVKVKT